MKDAIKIALPMLFLGLAMPLGHALAAEAPPPTQTPASESAASKVVEMGLSSTPWFFRGKPGYFAPRSSLMVGQKRGSWIMGAGIEVAFLRVPDFHAGDMLMLRRSFLITTFSATFQWAFAKSESRRVDYFLAGRPSIGIDLQNDNEVAPYGPPTRPPEQHIYTSMLFGLRAGPGFRVWAHPSLAFSMQAGLDVEGQVGLGAQAPSMPTPATGIDMGIYLSIGLMGAF